MAFGSPYSLGETNSGSGADTLQLTVSATSAAGDAIIVGASINSNSATASPSACVDSQGNKYTKVVTSGSGAEYQGTLFIATESSTNGPTTPLVSGTDTITVTYTTSTTAVGHNLQAMGCSGVAVGATTSTVDQTAFNGNTTTGTTVTATLPATTQSGELIISLVTTHDTANAVTWNTPLTQVNGPNVFAANQNGFLAAGVSTTAASTAYGGTVTSSGKWECVLASLLPLPGVSGAAALSGTGSLTASGVATTPGNAALSGTGVLSASSMGLGTFTGAYLDQTGMGAATWLSAGTQFAGWAGVPAIMVRRDYRALSDFTVDAKYATAAANGIKMCITLRPAYNPVSATDLANMTTFLQTLQGYGLDAEITLWHEPYYQGLTSIQYIAMVQYYGPTVRTYYPLAFVTALGSVTNNNENSYYPGDSWVDKVATDFYCINYVNGQVLGSASTVADSASPPKPFGVWEFNVLVNGGNYLIQPNCGFEGAGVGSIGTWTTTGNCGIAASSAQFHSGANSLALTSTAAGNMSAAHCLATAYATEMLACSPGDTIALNAWFKAATVARNCQPEAQFYTSSGTSISTLGVGGVTDSTSVWTQVSGNVTAPATAAWCRLVALVASTGGASEVHYVDDLSISDLSQGYTQTQGTQFISYLQQFMSNRQISSLANADVLFYNGAGVNSTEITGTPDYRLILYEEWSAPFPASAALYGTGVLSAASIVNFSAAAGLSGTGVLTSEPAVNYKAAASFSGSGSLTGEPAVNFGVGASLSGIGSIAAAAAAGLLASATLTGTGTLTSEPVANFKVGATLTGSGTLTGEPVVNVPLAASLTGIGVLTPNVVANQIRTQTLSGIGVLTSQGIANVPLAASLSGLGVFGASVVVNTGGAATLSGLGAITPNVIANQIRAQALSGTGVLTAAGVANFGVAASLSGLGALIGQPLINYEAGASLSGLGMLTAAAATSGAVTGAASLSGTGVLTASDVANLLVGAALSGIGAISAADVANLIGAATLSGTGVISASGVANFAVGAILSGVGVLSAEPAVNYQLKATISGTGVLTASSAVNFFVQTALSGAGVLSPTAAVNYELAAALTGIGVISAPVVANMFGAAVLSGLGTLTATYTISSGTGAFLAGIGVLSAAVIVNSEAAVALSGSGVLAAADVANMAGAVSLTGTGMLTASDVTVFLAAGGLSGIGAVTAARLVNVPVSASLNGTGVLSSVIVANFKVAASISGTGTITAIAGGEFTAGVALGGIGVLTAQYLSTFREFSVLSGIGVIGAAGQEIYSAYPGIVTIVNSAAQGIIVANASDGFVSIVNMAANAVNTVNQAANTVDVMNKVYGQVTIVNSE